MQSIHEQLLSLNLKTGPIQFDGKINRFKIDSSDTKKSGWYVGHQNFTVKTGEMFQVVVCGNFKTAETFVLNSGAEKLSQVDKKNLKNQIDQARRLEHKLRIENQERVADDLDRKWGDFQEFGVSEYLRKKRLTEVKNLGAKHDGEGSIYIPARDIKGKLWSWQKIQKDGGKWFASGGKIDESFHTLGNPKTAETIYICEGFATGASIFSATGKTTIIAFTANNLLKVTKKIYKAYPLASIIICGDDDRWTKKPDGTLQNTGKVKALEAAKQLFCDVVFPVFSDLTSKPTDFNDLHLLEGIDAVQKQLVKIKISEKVGVYALGYDGDNYFFTSTSNKKIVQIKNFNEDSFLKLMPSSYWEAEFVGRTGTQRVDWTMAKDALMTQCRDKGIFLASMTRGSGTWTDDSRVVINMGNHLLVDGVKMGLQTIKSKYIYMLSETVKPIHADPMTWQEARKLGDVCSQFKWSNPDSGKLLAGILVLARICGALPVRPHAWLTGSAASGKTTCLERLIHPMLGGNAFYAQSGTTEAGLRQRLGSNAFPVLFDEFESTGRGNNENIRNCIELMRASWASSGAMIYKGSPGGVVQQFQAHFSAIVSSIRTSLVNDADKGRFTVLELANHSSDQEHWDNLSRLLSEIDESYCDRIHARIVGMIPTILENGKVFKKAFAKQSGSRFGDQYGMILAGYAATLCDDVVTIEDAELVLEKMTFDSAKPDENKADHIEALEHLLTSSIPVQESSRKSDALIGDLIRDALLNTPHMVYSGEYGNYGEKVKPTQEERIRALQMVGISISSKLSFVAIKSANHTSLAKLWRGTKWADNWSTPLRRIEGVTVGTVRMGGTPVFSVKLPKKIFVG